MHGKLFFKALLAWFIIAILAVVNGTLREGVLVDALGSAALPVSGISLSLIVFFVAYVSLPFFGKNDNATYLRIGFLWVAITLLFEFIFGHFVAGKPWSVIFEVFDIMQGNLFSIVLAVTFISPYLVAKIRNV